MRKSVVLGAAPVALAIIMSAGNASAHCFVGGRFFPATLGVDDPCVADELSLPTVSALRTGDDPPVRQLDVSAEYSKRITESFGISFGSTWTHLSPPGMPSASGFQNLETTLKYQFLTVPEHEFVMAAGVAVEWGNTGAAGVGAESFTTTTPTLYIGKGFGDLPDTVGWARPIGVTLQIGYAIPSSAAAISIDPDSGDTIIDNRPRFLRYGGSLQYSMPFLKSSVVDLQLPDFVNRLIPIVEWNLQTTVAHNLNTEIGTTGTINPGVIWVGNSFQVALEAIVPINRASGSGVGAMAQLHLYLDDIFPTTIGKPIFGTAVNPGRPIFGN